MIKEIMEQMKTDMDMVCALLIMEEIDHKFNMSNNTIETERGIIYFDKNEKIVDIVLK